MNEALLDELEALARMVSRMPDLVVREGRAGSGWSFHHQERMIRMDAASLQGESRDFNRGLVLHELAHAVMTRLHFHPRNDYVRREDIYMAIGALEDTRIESWLMQRYPGARPWITGYNNKLLSNTVDQMASLPWTKLPPLESFVAGIMARWWHGPDRIRLPAAVASLVEEAWPHVERICQAIPDTLPSRAVPDEYRKSIVSGLYLMQDAALEPDPAEMEIRLRQGDMWDAFMTGILPIIQRLAPPAVRRRRHRRSPLHPLFSRWGPASEWQESAGSMPFAAQVHALRSARPASRRQALPWPSDPVAYGKAVEAQRPAIQRLRRVVESVFPPERSRSWVGPRSSGLRLQLRGAHQAEADPRREALVWERRSPPSRPRPHLAVLVDRSGSMKGPRMTAAFAGCVLLAEVCCHARVPLSVLTFSTTCELVVGPDDPLDDVSRARLGGLHRAADGGTRMAEALQHARKHLDESPCRERFLVVLGDGDDSDAAVREMAHSIMADGIRLVGLGVGPESHGMQECIPHARTGLEAKSLPGAFASVLEEVIQGRHTHVAR